MFSWLRWFLGAGHSIRRTRRYPRGRNIVLALKEFAVQGDTTLTVQCGTLIKSFPIHGDPPPQTVLCGWIIKYKQLSLAPTSACLKGAIATRRTKR